jgi:hypothetical protein
MVHAQLNGFLPPDFTGPMATIDLRNPSQRPEQEYSPVEIRDARLLQAAAPSEAAFLAEHGFVLLPHTTAVRDWDRDVDQVYLPEVEAVIRNRLFPGRPLEVQQASAGLLRRGRGTETPGFADGVHSDAPLNADLYAKNVRAFASDKAEEWWRRNYERDDAAGFVNLDFWRITNMNSPLRHMPLAVCDPGSLDRADIVEMPMRGIAPVDLTTHHLALRFNANQRWYHYPHMTTDELLVFKLGEYWKDAPDRAPQNCFHSAFVDPETPPDAEERQSCEHRVGVLILRD